MRNGSDSFTTAVVMILTFAAALLCPLRPASADQPQALTVRDYIQMRLAEGYTHPVPTVRGEAVYSLEMLNRFYQNRDFQPAWINKNDPRPQAEELIAAIREVYRDGLEPEYYHIGGIESAMRELRDNGTKKLTPDPEILAELDLLFTDSFLLLSCHLSNGCVNPVKLKAEWFTYYEKMNAAAVLEKALQKNQVKDTLHDLAPKQEIYPKLKQALARYRKITAKGGWPVVPDGPPLKKYQRSARTTALRQRLAATGDLAVAEAGGGDLFDAELEGAVRRFQKRHGLDADGIVGPQTLAALNIPAAKRVRQIELNMERLRWSFRGFGERYIAVNIANFSLDVVESGSTVFSMKVVVGKPFWYTPVFSEKMTYLVLNPAWNIPTSIAVEEILPQVRVSPTYLTRQHIAVLRNGKPLDEKELRDIDWSQVTADRMPYRFRQEPGPWNPLGRVKFMFPNKFEVYLHDSPNKGLFQQTVRAFSHGCIRIEKPVELAAYLLRDDPKWTRDEILRVIQEGREQTIRLPEPVYVHLLYLTAWVDGNNVLQFRNDVYDRDTKLEEALATKSFSGPGDRPRQHHGN